MKTAIITGAGGFVGKALTKYLLNMGWKVFAVVRNAAKLNDVTSDRLEVVVADMREYRDLDKLIKARGVDAFFYLAWDGTSGDSYLDHERQLKNAVCAADAMNAANVIGVGRFLFMNSIVALEAKHYMLADGGMPRNACIYGASKCAADLICKTLAFRFGIAYNTAVLASAYGEGDHSTMVQNTLIRAFQRGESPKLADADSLYDWIYIDDIVAATLAIAEKGKPDKVYYIGHRELHPFSYFVTNMRDVVAPDVQLTFGTLKFTTVTDYSLIDREALFQDTGFECKADLRESISKTAAWLKKLDSEK